MIIDREIEKYFKDFKTYIENNKNIDSEKVYNKIKENMKLLGYKEISFNNSYIENVDIYTIKYHKFDNNDTICSENCIEYVINITLFDNNDTNKISLSVNYSEIKTTQKTLF